MLKFSYYSELIHIRVENLCFILFALMDFTSIFLCILLYSFKFCLVVWILKILKKEGLVDENTIVKPNIAQTKDLLVAHSEQYLKSLKVNSEF